MRFVYLLALAGPWVIAAQSQVAPFQPIVPSDFVLAETDGRVVGEAEHFVRQEHTSVRAWHRVTQDNVPEVEPDGDPSHADTASSRSYIECLPDTRRGHGDPLVVSENFSNEAGRMAVLSYRIHFSNPGRYYVWLRTFSTNTEDNGAHVGLDADWPENGRRWQTTHKHAWMWDCRQRTTEVHAGVPMQLYLEVPSAGEHLFQISMREDGVEIDQWLLTRDIDFRPEGALAPSKPLEH